MPISGPTSYLGTTDQFIAHWESANTALGAGNEIVLVGPIPIATLQTKKDNLVAKRALVEAKVNVLEAARGDIENRKAGLLLRLNQLKDVVAADLAGSKYERTMPLVPSIGDGQGVFVKAMDDGNTAWEMINADPALPDVTLLGGYTQANFAADIAALGAAYTTYNKASKVVEITLEERNDIQDEIYPILLAYRKKLPTKFAANHALVQTLPDVTPAPGSTPPGPVGNGSYDNATSQAKLTSTAVNDPNVTQIEWRYCLGASYSTDLEAVVPGGSFSGNGATELFTAIGLTSPGAAVSFKPYSITATGNEKGGNTVTVIRPSGPTPP